MDINILICADHGFVMPCGIALQALCANHKDNIVHVYLITDESFTEEDRSDIKQIVLSSNADNTISFLLATDDMMSAWSWHKNSYYPKQVFYRLLCADLLLESVDRILYIDCDVIVRKSLAELWDMDLQDSPLAACPDASERGFRIGFNENDEYYNSGVLLMNMDYWRKNNCKKQLFDFIDAHPGEYRLPDQDPLNIIFKETKKHLDIKYNLQPIALYKDKYIEFNWQKYGEEFRNAQINPSIIHFAGARPWEKGCTHPYKEEWYKYQRMTKWADVPLRPSRVTIKEHLKNVIRAILTPIGICHYVYDYYNRNLKLV